MIKDRNTLDI